MISEAVRLSLVALVSGVLGVGSASAVCLMPPGDVNGTGDVNVADVQCGILAALHALSESGLPSPPCLVVGDGIADLDCSGEPNVGDVQILIQLALQMGLSPLIDSDGDSCPTACEPCDENNGGCGPAEQVLCVAVDEAGVTCEAYCGAAMDSVHTCDIRLSKMKGYPVGDYSSYGLSGQATFVHSSAFKAPKILASDMEGDKSGALSKLAIYWNATPEKVAISLNNYCGNNIVTGCDVDASDVCCSEVTGIVVADIEHPYHLMKLYKFEEVENGILDPGDYHHTFDEVVEGFKMRLSVAQEVFPNAVIGLYGIITGTAVPSVNEEAKNTVLQAVAMGLLDHVDLGVPVLYPRLGPGETPDLPVHAVEYTGLVMEAAEWVVSGLDPPVGLAPALSRKIFNGGSVNQGLTAPIEYVGAQLDTLQMGQFADTYMFWIDVEGPADGEFFEALSQESILNDCLCGELD